MAIKNERPEIVAALERYVKSRIMTGEFMRAILENDLNKACLLADTFNRYMIWDIVNYCRYNLPGSCWGSKEKVDKWVSKKL